MKRGRKKNPENVAEGSQPKAVPGKVSAPGHLNPLAVAIFDRVAKTLDEMNILTIGDLDIVASYAEVAALGQHHKKLLDDNGATQTAKTGFVVMRPDYTIWRDCQKSGQKILQDLGLTPASRTRVAAAVAAEADEFAEFMARRNAQTQAQETEA
jgi:P27 family predicted phage terminase small subunit